jgi:hypothetical protein
MTYHIVKQPSTDGHYVTLLSTFHPCHSHLLMSALHKILVALYTLRVFNNLLELCIIQAGLPAR